MKTREKVTPAEIEAWRKKRNEIICKDDVLLSLLYDLDLLPEQVKPDTRDEFKLNSVVAHWITRNPI